MADDFDDDPPCYRHPRRTTALSCNSCGRPICTECAVAAPVGLKCPECARLPKGARGAVPVHRLARGVVVGIVAALVLGSVYTVVAGGILGLIVGVIVGIAIAEVVRWAAGGFRDHRIGVVAAACTVVAIAGPVAIDVSRYGVDVLTSQGELYSLVAALIAAIYAYNRVR